MIYPRTVPDGILQEDGSFKVEDFPTLSELMEKENGQKMKNLFESVFPNACKKKLAPEEMAEFIIKIGIAKNAETNKKLTKEELLDSRNGGLFLLTCYERTLEFTNAIDELADKSETIENKK